MLGLSMVLYDVLWYVPLLILAVRAFFISFANNLPHYGTANDDRLYGLNLSMPRWAHHFYLNFYHHRAHHHEPLVPWTGLPDSFRDQGMEYDMPFLSAALAQFKGPKPMPPAASDAGAA
jgi:fatty acid desaturase